MRIRIIEQVPEIRLPLVRIHTLPEDGAEVFLEDGSTPGKLQGTTPAAFGLPVGYHRLRLRMPGYQDTLTRVYVSRTEEVFFVPMQASVIT